MIAICFDYYDFDSPMATTIDRTRQLKGIFKSLEQVEPHGDVPVRMVHTFSWMDGNQPEQLKEAMDNVLSQGGEGLMLQELSSPYVFERTDNLLKVKRLEEYEGEIIGFKRGRPGTRLEGSVAAIVCRIDGCDNEVRVGTGLSDLDRELFAKNRQELIGARVEVEAFSKTVNKDGLTSLCFPVFKRCLHDLFGGVE